MSRTIRLALIRLAFLVLVIMLPAASCSAVSLSMSAPQITPGPTSDTLKFKLTYDVPVPYAVGHGIDVWVMVDIAYSTGGSTYNSPAGLDAAHANYGAGTTLAGPVTIDCTPLSVSYMSLVKTNCPIACKGKANVTVNVRYTLFGSMAYFDPATIGRVPPLTISVKQTAVRPPFTMNF